MPKPIVIDPGDRGMVNQATGKPVYENEISSPVVAPDSKSSDKSSDASTGSSSSTPFMRTVRNGYAGISGGTPITSKSKQPRQEWSPIYSSLLDGNPAESGEQRSYWDYMQEGEGDQTGEAEVGALDQQSETSSGLVPEVKVESSSMDSRSDTNWNDVYERDMTNRGLSDDYIDRVLKETNGVSAAIDQDNGLNSKWRKDLLDPLTTTIDDGTMDRPHLLSDWMTGKQYYHYVHDLGIPGLPEDQIDISDNGRYSKTQERQVNGFQPYVPNSTYELGMSIPNLASASRTIHDYISNLRTNGFLDDVDYQITTDTGHGVKSFSGRDFEKMSNGYASRVNDLYDRALEGDPDAMSVLTSSENHSSPYTTMVRERELPDGSKHYGVVTESHDVNDLADEDVFNDLVWWDINNNTQATYPDENGISTYGNTTLKFDGNGNILSGTLHTKDGFDLNIEPDPNNGFRLVTDDDAFNNWWNSHYNGNRYVAFSDGSSAVLSSEDIDKAIKKSPNGSWIGDTLVPYESTSLKDMDGFDPESLTVGNPTSLRSRLRNGKGSEIGMMYMPDMVLSDGTSISRDAAFKIANDDNPNDSDEDGITYDFEFSGLNPLRLLSNGPSMMPMTAALAASNPLLALTDSRPRSLMHDSPIENGIHLDEIPNWLADAGADSIPISTPGFQYVDAFANALPYVAGIESSSGDEYGRYQTTGYDVGSEENAMKTASSLFGPTLENLAGYGHEPKLDPIVEKLIGSKYAEGTLQNLLLSKGWDSAGEAMEEIFGNYVDEPSVYGLKNAWADPISRPYAGMGGVYDKDHNLLYDIGDDVSDEELSNIYDDMMKNYGQNGRFPVLYDEHGREFRDPSTSPDKRFLNAFAPTPEHWNETANAALGGAGVSTLYSMPEIMYGLGSHLMTRKQRNENFSPREWDVNAVGNEDMGSSANDIYVPESVRSDRISSNDYRISPGAPIKFKE